MDECHMRVINRLKRLEGQVRGIQRMIEKGEDCTDIISQMSAVRSAVNHTMGIMMTENLKQIVNNPVDDPEEQKQRLDKAIDLIIKK